jgi:hypothetical protein
MNLHGKVGEQGVDMIFVRGTNGGEGANRLSQRFMENRLLTAKIA